MPWQMTVEQLRGLLSGIPGEVVVGLRVPAPGLGDPELEVVYNLSADYDGGPVFVFSPLQAGHPRGER